MTRDLVESTELWSFWSNVGVVAFSILAAIFAGFALYFNWKLTASKDAELQHFQTESATDIARSNSLALAAEEGAAKAVADAAAANERSQTLEVEAAQQRGRAANAERELLEIRERLAPRRLTAEQQQMIVKKLRPFAPQQFDISATSTDLEVVQIRNQVIAVLSEAGWSLGSLTGWGLGLAVSGILIEIIPTSEGSARTAAQELAAALRTENLAVNGPVEAVQRFTAPIRLTFGPK